MVSGTPLGGLRRRLDDAGLDPEEQLHLSVEKTLSWMLFGRSQSFCKWTVAVTICSGCCIPDK
jgi:hypothetical protein